MASINDVALADRKRFAVAFAFANDRNDIDWTAAAMAHDTKVKPQSFRTVTQRALKKAGASNDVSEGDISRFALCYIFAKNRHDIDWTAAATAYDTNVKPQSFRTVTQRALKKVLFAPSTAPNVAAAKTTKKAVQGKRKAGLEQMDTKSSKKSKVKDERVEDDMEPTRSSVGDHDFTADGDDIKAEERSVHSTVAGDDSIGNGEDIVAEKGLAHSTAGEHDSAANGNDIMDEKEHRSHSLTAEDHAMLEAQLNGDI